MVPAGELDVVTAVVQPTETDEVGATPADGEATEEATSETGGVDCAQAERWLVETLGRAGRTRTLETPVPQVLDDAEAEPFTDLEPGALGAAAVLNELAKAQRDAEAPAGAEVPGRSLTSATESFARGLNLLATAVANENAEALDHARALLLDAGEARAAAGARLAGLAQACDIRR